MLRIPAALILALAATAAAVPARADSGPVIVIPSRPGIPVMIHGRDASYAVVEGDWGLARPGHMGVTVIGGGPPRASSVYAPRNTYHPRYGRAPERGRHEIEPPADRALPEPAESFSRSWSTHGPPQPARQVAPPQRGDSDRHVDAPAFNPGIDPVPPTINDPQPFNPPVIVAPQFRRP